MSSYEREQKCVKWCNYNSVYIQCYTEFHEGKIQENLRLVIIRLINMFSTFKKCENWCIYVSVKMGRCFDMSWIRKMIVVWYLFSCYRRASFLMTWHFHANTVCQSTLFMFFSPRICFEKYWSHIAAHLFKAIYKFHWWYYYYHYQVLLLLSLLLSELTLYLYFVNK